MAFNDSLSAYWTKANDAGFQNRLAVVLMAAVQFHLARAKGGAETVARYQAIQAFARVLRARVTSREWLVRYGLQVLWSVDAENVDDDAAFRTLVTAVLPQLPDADLPA